MPIISTPVPAKIITGFLGSGKTTAIRHLFTYKPDTENWAVLINEFGEIGWMLHYRIKIRTKAFLFGKFLVMESDVVEPELPASRCLGKEKSSDGFQISPQ